MFINNPIICPSCDCQEVTYGCSGGDSVKISINFPDSISMNIFRSGTFIKPLNTDVTITGLSTLNGTYIIDSDQSLANTETSPVSNCRIYPQYLNIENRSATIIATDNIYGSSLSITKNFDYLLPIFSPFLSIDLSDEDVLFGGFQENGSNIKNPNGFTDSYLVDVNFNIETSGCRNIFTDLEQPSYSVTTKDSPFSFFGQNNILTNIGTGVNASVNFRGFVANSATRLVNVGGFIIEEEGPTDRTLSFVDNKSCFLNLKSATNKILAGTYTKTGPYEVVSSIIINSDFEYSFLVETV